VNLSEYPDVGKVDEVAAVARYDRKTVYGAIERGELQAVRCGRAIRVTKVALLHWLNLDVGPPRRKEGPSGETGPFSNKSEQDSDLAYPAR
jgi:excisionase family DNA binding protein